jgi:hypothetical protein
MKYRKSLIGRDYVEAKMVTGQRGVIALPSATPGLLLVGEYALGRAEAAALAGHLDAWAETGSLEVKDDGWAPPERYYVYDRETGEVRHWGDTPPPGNQEVAICYWEQEGVAVCTRFTCRDRGFGGAPILWETCVAGLGGFTPWVYDRKDEAVAGHRAVVRMVEKQLGLSDVE